MNYLNYSLEYINKVRFNCNHCIMMGMNEKCDGTFYTNKSPCYTVRKNISKLIGNTKEMISIDS